MTNDLIVPEIEHDEAWQEIVNTLVEDLAQEDAPDNVITAAELMVAGWPTYKIAKELGVTTKTVKRWLAKYPQMTRAVAVARENVQKWRLEQLERQFVTAVTVSHDILTADDEVAVDTQGNVILDEDGEPIIISPNAKLLGVQGQHARYILSLFLGNKFDLNINIRDETPVMQAKADALNYLAKKLADLHLSQEPRETVVIVQDPQTGSGPYLDEEDNPAFGVLGELDRNEDGTLCHMCGNRFKQLEIHVRTKHKVSNDLYETTFMLPPGALKDDAAKS